MPHCVVLIQEIITFTSSFLWTSSSCGHWQGHPDTYRAVKANRGGTDVPPCLSDAGPGSHVPFPSHPIFLLLPLVLRQAGRAVSLQALCPLPQPVAVLPCVATGTPERGSIHKVLLTGQ